MKRCDLIQVWRTRSECLRSRAVLFIHATSNVCCPPYPNNKSLSAASTRTRLPQTSTTEPSMQRSPSVQGINARFLQHEDSGVRIPPAEYDVIELPPLYTPFVWPQRVGKSMGLSLPIVSTASVPRLFVKAGFHSPA